MDYTRLGVFKKLPSGRKGKTVEERIGAGFGVGWRERTFFLKKKRNDPEVGDVYELEWREGEHVGRGGLELEKKKHSIDCTSNTVTIRDGDRENAAVLTIKGIDDGHGNVNDLCAHLNDAIGKAPPLRTDRLGGKKTRKKTKSKKFRKNRKSKKMKKTKIRKKSSRKLK